MTSTLKSGGRGALYTLIAQALILFLQFSSFVVLSRLLSPFDFGIVAMVMVFLALGNLLRDLGISTVALQRPRLSNAQASNLFWVTSLLGTVSTFLLITITPLLVFIYDENKLWEAVPGLAPILLFNGISTIFRVQLLRSMKFIKINVIEITTQALIVIVSIICALNGLGYWALIVGNLAGTFIQMISVGVLSEWKPDKYRRGFGSKLLLKDSLGFGFVDVLNYLTTNIDSLVIGVRWNANYLGIYNRGYRLYHMGSTGLLAPLSQVVIPTLSKASEEKQNVDDLLLRIQFSLSLVSAIIFAAAGSSAGFLIPLLLGNGWESAISIFQILALGGMVMFLTRTLHWRIILANQGVKLAKIYTITNMITISLIICGSLFSLKAIAWALSVGALVSWLLTLTWFRAPNPWPSSRYLKEGLRTLIPGVLSYAAGIYTFETLNVDLLNKAVFAVVAVLLTYLLGVLLIPGGLKRVKTIAEIFRILVTVKKSK